MAIPAGDSDVVREIVDRGFFTCSIQALSLKTGSPFTRHTAFASTGKSASLNSFVLMEVKSFGNIPEWDLI